jgi:trk system potassium uptake protein
VNKPVRRESTPNVKLRRQKRLRTALRLVTGLAILVAAGTLALLLPGVGIRPMPLGNAVFTATSALAVTGLSVITPATDLTAAGQIVLMLLIQIGGVGFMGGAVIILRLLGRRVSLADRLALRDSLGLLEPRAIVAVIWRVLVTAVVIESLGATVLWLNWRDQLGDAHALLFAAFHAVSAFCNAGFDLFTGAPGLNGLPNDSVTLVTFSSLIILGGLGIPVLGNLFWERGRLTLHTRITLVIYAVLIALGSAGFLIAETQEGRSLTSLPPDRALLFSTFQSISARTAGFAILPSLDALAPASQWLMIGLMLIGCAPASMGGGITTGTLAVLLLSLWGYAQGKQAAEIGGRTVSQDAVRRAGAVLTTSLLVVGTATWLLLVTQQTTLETALFEVVSAFATCGLTLAFTPTLNTAGRIIIMLVMFWGRLGALTVVAALAQQAPPQALRYPEETLLIG